MGARTEEDDPGRAPQNPCDTDRATMRACGRAGLQDACTKKGDTRKEYILFNFGYRNLWEMVTAEGGYIGVRDRKLEIAKNVLVSV